MVNPISGTPITQADLDNHNLQGLVELVYVQTANNVLNDSMASLETALKSTQASLQQLTILQNLHNRIDVRSKSAFSFNYYRNYDTSFSEEYQKQASAYFGTPIDPFFPLSANDPEFDDFQAQLLSAKNQVKLLISALAQITPTGSGGAVDPNSLLGRLQTVYNDLQDIDTYSGVANWVLDNYNVHSSGSSSQAGNIQMNLNLAITAGQNLNDTQTASVRNYLFIFEEYYKSASGILTKLSQLIEKMGQNISR